MSEHAIVNSSELGTNCWLPVRFCGGRCQRVMVCKYPEKRTCKAVQTELEHSITYTQQQVAIIRDYQTRKQEYLRGCME